MSQNDQRHLLKILQQLLQFFWIVSNHFATLCMKGLTKLYIYSLIPTAYRQQYIIGTMRLELL